MRKMVLKTVVNILKKIRNCLKTSFQGNSFLCDTCKYDWGSACQRPERPNATKCPDYKHRG